MGVSPKRENKELVVCFRYTLLTTFSPEKQVSRQSRQLQDNTLEILMVSSPFMTAYALLSSPWFPSQNGVYSKSFLSPVAYIFSVGSLV